MTPNRAWQRRGRAEQVAREAQAHYGHQEDRCAACGAERWEHSSPDFGVYAGCARTRCAGFVEQGEPQQ
jgi:hypothetical protein